MKKGKLQFVKKAYTLDYLMNNPPASAKGLKLVWSAALTWYFAKEGIDLTDAKNYKKPVENIDFAEITRTFKKLVNDKSRPAKRKKAA